MVLSSADDSPFAEDAAWKPIHGVWKQLHGGFHEHGVSLEWHEFQVESDLNWAKSFHPESLEICLNFGGEGSIGNGKTAQHLGAGEIAIYRAQSEAPHASRESGSIHRFATLEVSAEFLHEEFRLVQGNLRPEVRRFLEHPGQSAELLGHQSLPTHLMALRMQILEPPVFSSAHSIWYQSKVLEILAQTLFQDDQPAELFCHQHKRLNRERIERVRFLLERDLENPPSLTMLGEEVNCSPFHLSRLFAEQSGVSIPKYLRQRRIEKAAELLRTGDLSVTDVAMAVGYSSLSAFIKAFAGHFGVLPGQFVAQGGVGK